MDSLKGLSGKGKANSKSGAETPGVSSATAGYVDETVIAPLNTSAPGGAEFDPLSSAEITDPGGPPRRESTTNDATDLSEDNVEETGFHSDYDPTLNTVKRKYTQPPSVKLVPVDIERLESVIRDIDVAINRESSVPPMDKHDAYPYETTILATRPLMTNQKPSFLDSTAHDQRVTNADESSVWSQAYDLRNVNISGDEEESPEGRDPVNGDGTLSLEEDLGDAAGSSKALQAATTLYRGPRVAR